jgi:hypothetical protein
VTVAALYVETGGVYYGLPDVDPWDEERDARLYEGPWPVVAHPPCNRWSIMVESNPQIRDQLGQDGGTFAAALDAVRTFGGVLEHPALTRAWRAHGLPRASSGGWATTFDDPGYATEVDQGRYGHVARKMTWLYCCGIEPPALKWGDGGQRERNTRNMASTNGDRSRTPLGFRDVLLDMARSASPALHRLDGCA